MSNLSTVEQLSPLMNTYARFPLTLVKGKGSYVWDSEGKQYLDFCMGIATCNLGHAPEAVKEALTKQLATLWHCSNLFHIPWQEELAALLVEHTCADQVFFCNSGAEANEAAIKIARRYAQHIQKTDRYEIVTFQQSFHGRTMATLSATGQEKIQQGFMPKLEGFRYLPYNDFSALQEVVQEKTCAVMLELVQGEGGVTPANPEWVKQLSELCQDNGLLFMVDEIQTGMGRTGTLFAYEQYGIEPDVFTSAKGLGSGFPIGALLAKKEVAQAFDHGSHGSTFGGNPLATTAGLATLKTILAEGVVEKAAKLGEYLGEQLQKLAEKYSAIQETRGTGLLRGLVMKEPSAGEIVQAARDKQVLILTAGPNVVRILPALTATEGEVDQLIAVLDEIFSQLVNS